MEQSDEDLAEMVARFRTPPGLNWKPLRDDILTILRSRQRKNEMIELNALMAMNSARH